MQASASASYDDLLKSAADPSSPLHNVYLLMEIRKHRKEASDQRVQRCKLELAKKLADGQKEVSDSVAQSMANKRKSLSNYPGAGDSRRTDEKRYSFPPGDSKAASRLSAVSKKSSIGLKSLRSTSSDIAVISDFYAVIELISQFYNISDHEEFVRNRNQLMETLSLLKNYKSFDDVLNQYVKKYKNLCDLKRRYDDVVGEEANAVYSTENL